MHKFSSFAIILFLFSLFIGKQSYAVLERFNVGVGYGGTNELTISTDSPGEFNYHLYLRTANNTGSTVKVHYTGTTNLLRAIRMSCATDEVNALDNPVTGTCISGGPFVRGAFVAGNDNQYAIVKRFTLFCGSIQVTGEESTNSWNTNFDNSAIENFLDNGASSTWCPVASASTPTSVIVPAKKLTVTPKPTKKPTVIRKPSPTEKVATSSPASNTPIPTSIPAGIKDETPKNNSGLPLALILTGLGVLAAVGYFNRKTVVTIFRLLKNRLGISQAEKLSSVSFESQVEDEKK